MHELAGADRGQRPLEPSVEIDVGGARLVDVALELLQVEPGVDAITGGESLEPEPVTVGRDDGVRRPHCCCHRRRRDIEA